MTLSIADVLSIYIITYNRSKTLLRTLTDLRGSPFGGCTVTVLDNCSTDETNELFSSHFSQVSNFIYARNVTNIGASANALQAFLLSKTTYTWVLCDDDFFSFDSVHDVVTALMRQEVDMIQVGGHACATRPCSGETATPKDLISGGNNYFRDCSFLPSTIYRTSFSHRNISQCYAYSYFMYPHMAMVIAAYREGVRIYISKERLVTPSIGTQSYSRGDQFEWWFKLSESSRDSGIRNQLLMSQWVGPLDKSGLYGLLNTAVRLKKYFFAIKIVAYFRFAVLRSICRMLVNRFVSKPSIV